MLIAVEFGICHREGRRAPTAESIQILRTAVIEKDAVRRPHVLQMLDDKVKFPVVRKMPLVPKKEQKLFRAKRPTTYAQ